MHIVYERFFTARLVSIAGKYSAHPQECSVVFVTHRPQYLSITAAAYVLLLFLIFNDFCQTDYLEMYL